MKQIIILTTYFFLISTSYAQNNIWTLEQCVKHALENNITILQAQNSLLSSEQDIVSAKGNFLPAVNSNRGIVQIVCRNFQRVLSRSDVSSNGVIGIGP